MVYTWNHLFLLYYQYGIYSNIFPFMLLFLLLFCLRLEYKLYHYIQDELFTSVIFRPQLPHLPPLMNLMTQSHQIKLSSILFCDLNLFLIHNFQEKMFHYSILLGFSKFLMVKPLLTLNLHIFILFMVGFCNFSMAWPQLDQNLIPNLYHPSSIYTMIPFNSLMAWSRLALNQYISILIMLGPSNFSKVWFHPVLIHHATHLIFIFKLW